MKKNKKYAIPHRDKTGKLCMIPGINNFGDKGTFNNESRVHDFKLKGKKIIDLYCVHSFEKYCLEVDIIDFIKINFSEN